MAFDTFRIHHLSDVHFGPAHYRAMRAGAPVPEGGPRNSSAYLAYLSSLPDADFPHIIIVSGDLTTSAQEDEMAESSQFLNKIANAPGWTRRNPALGTCPRVLIVPGNHDLDWKQSDTKSKHRRFGFMSDSVRGANNVASSTHHLEPCPGRGVDLGDEANIFIYLLNSTSLGGTNDPAIKDLYDSLARSRANLSVDDIEAFNRAMKRDPGYVDSIEIAAMKEAAARVPKERVKIAVVHHHPNHVPSDDIDAFDTILNAGILKAALFNSGFDIVLHGHRHIFHCSSELKPLPGGNSSRLHFIGADSLGCNVDAPFVELTIAHPASAHRQAITVSRFSVREFYYSTPNGYAPEPPALEEVLGPPILSGSASSPFEKLLQLAARDTAAPEADKPELQSALRILVPRLQRLQSRWSDWSDDSDWIRQFHFQIKSYLRIYATAISDRPAAENPNYHRYLREQFEERLLRLRAREDKILYFSHEVFQAITRTGWRPNQTLYKDYKMMATDNEEHYALEIVRVIVCDRATINTSVLYNMDFDHRLFAVPLFLIEKDSVEPEQRVDFAIGMIKDGRPNKGCAYDPTVGKVQEQPLLRACDLRDSFDRLLRNQKLRTVARYLGNSPMNADAAASHEYFQLRKPSKLIVDLIAKYVGDARSDGLDLCCGTGNYTLPFTAKFKRLRGLDLDPDMLSYARNRSVDVQWIEADAKDTQQEAASFDAVWMISALHYFKDAEQLMVFREIFRILRPGGIFIADTEFLGQHESLWITEYLPSLRDRYRDSLFHPPQYIEWLTSAGFSHVDFETADYQPEEGDAFLRIGQHKPELYLDPKIQAAIPAFRTVQFNERVAGMRQLKEDIQKGEIKRVMDRYRKKATMPGDLGVIIARKD